MDRAMPTAPEKKCAHVTRAGKRYEKRLDKYGYHATACGDGGGWVARHNGIVRVLAESCAQWDTTFATARVP